MLLPAVLRRKLNLQPGDELIIRLEENQLRLIPLKHTVARAQKKVRQYIPADVSLIKAPLEERRVEADHD